ncbi:MAG: shikimate dehydrogenase [Gemmatimonadaceae bacterium]
MTGLPGRLVLLGHPVAHSLSPIFQQAALDRAGIALRYDVADVPPVELGAVLRSLRPLRGAGNLTIPHKRAGAACCDRLTPVAARTGAVNTFWYEGSELLGDNTDVMGFDGLITSLGLARVPQRVLLLGAGGAAAAVCEAVASWTGARVVIASRSRGSAQDLVLRYAHIADIAADVATAARTADLVVNATPVGLRDDGLPLPLTLLARDAVVTDLVYRRGETAWVREARRAGHVAADGLVMLLEQGVAAFRRWFGMEPDREAMWSALRTAAR